MSVEIGPDISRLRYHYKYVDESDDWLTVDLSTDWDEIDRFRDSRWLAPPESRWRIF